MCSAVATFYTVKTGDELLGPSPQAVMRLVVSNLLFLCFMGGLVIFRVRGLWKSIRRNTGTTQLQRRILLMFSTLTILPALVVSLFTVFLFYLGMQSWFHSRVSTALNESVNVAQSYLLEHQSIIRADAIAMAADLDRQLIRIMGTPGVLNSIINRQAALRSLTEGIVIQDNRIIAQTALSFALAFERVDEDKRHRADQGEAVVWLDDPDRLRALVKLTTLPDTYVLVGRLLDNRVLQYVDNATGAVVEYRKLQQRVAKLQQQFALIFGLLVVLFVLLSVWYGTQFAASVLLPVSRLIHASHKLASGDYEVSVANVTRGDEIAVLVQAFNGMAQEIRTSHQRLLMANETAEERRQFIETVLSEVSAGVIAFDQNEKITLCNYAAVQIIGDDESDHFLGQSILSVFTELHDVLQLMKEQRHEQWRQQLKVSRKGNQRHLFVHLTAQRKGSEVTGYVLTFDDLTALVSAQRNAAWADVARRVAHEIKNPLTPIQLSAERLRRKYSPQINEDLATYQRYVDTIIRHVGDIGRMVDEFVSFARMPAPEFKREDIRSLINKVIFSEKVAHPAIGYQLDYRAEAIHVQADERQIIRVFTNLLKNAAEAIESAVPQQEQQEDGSYRAKRHSIDVTVTQRREKATHELVVTIQDTGPGFPTELLERIMEPYVTTREKGSGLGLAIVKKIVEDHGGEMSISNRNQVGAEVILIFPIDGDKNVT